MHWLHLVRQIDKMARSLLHDLCFGLYILDLGGPHGYMLRQWLKVLPPAESDAQVTDHPPVCHEASPTDS